MFHEVIAQPLFSSDTVFSLFSHGICIGQILEPIYPNSGNPGMDDVEYAMIHDFYCLQHSWGCTVVLTSMWRTCGASWAVAPPTVAWWLAPSSSPSWVCSPSLSVRRATLSGREATASRTMSPRATRCSARWTSAFLRWWRPWGPVSRLTSSTLSWATLVSPLSRLPGRKRYQK